MCYLTTVVGSFHGRVLAARLGAEGILVVLKGATEGPYPLQVAVDVLVPADQLKAAREILLGDAIDDLFGEMAPVELDDPFDAAAASPPSWDPEASAGDADAQAAATSGDADRAVHSGGRSRPHSLPTVVAVVVVTIVIMVGFVAAAVH
jgi:hypothetical protein